MGKLTRSLAETKRLLPFLKGLVVRVQSLVLFQGLFLSNFVTGGLGGSEVVVFVMISHV